MDLVNVKGLNKSRIKILNSYDIFNTNDLINYFPKKYIDLKLRDNLIPGNITVSGIISSRPFLKTMPNKINMLLFYIDFNGYNMKCLYFGKPYFLSNIKLGTKIILNGEFNFIKQQFQINKVYFDDYKEEILSVYNIKGISDKVLNKIILDYILMNNIKENLPIEYINKYKLLGRKDFYLKKHLILNKTDFKEVYRREKYEMFFNYFLQFRVLNYKNENIIKKEREPFYNEVNEFIKKFPFKLTNDQLNAIDILLDKLKEPKNINTLIEGDVGCGKTVIAYVMSYVFILNKMCSCFIAPTEMLAKQHYLNYKKYLSDYNVCLITSSTKNKEEIYKDISLNKYDVIIGTHAIFNENINFNNLGLILIDEQHRFGVKQRSFVQKRYENVDAIYFSATPIPRTLGLTMFGSLNIIDIKEMPKNRKVTKSYLYPFSKLNMISEFINLRCKLGEQVFIVVPSINDNILNTMSVESAYEYFSKTLEYSIKCIHSKVSNDDKNQIMEDFQNNKFSVLISTTIIEVGIDIKGATTLVLLNAERYGLATSHQLRGRIGRNELDSYFIMVSDDLNNERLQVLLNESDGFKIASEDFKLRGPGDYLGEIQSGNLIDINYNSEYELKIMNQANIDANHYLEKLIKDENKLNNFLDEMKVVFLN